MSAPRLPLRSATGEQNLRLARELVAARAVAGLTQRELGDRSGVSQSFVSAAERARRLPSLPVLRRMAHATGHDLVVRLFPADGVHLRDSGQLAVAHRIRVQLDRSWRVRLEVPVGLPPDRRAADMVLESPDETIQIEIERSLLDLQAQLRAAQVKRTALAQRLGRRVRLLIAVPDTTRNRALVDALEPLVSDTLPVPTRRLWSLLRRGDPVMGDGLLWVRVGRATPSRPDPA